MTDTSESSELAALARPSGGFAMVAVDARGSMRAILRDAGVPNDDASFADFKTRAADAAAVSASAVLCDPVYGHAAIEMMRTGHPHAGLVVAVDRFDEPRHGPLQESSLDPAALDWGAKPGVHALKLYLIYRRDQDPRLRVSDARRFVERCRELGVTSLIEGVVADAAQDPFFDDTLARAAEEFGAFGPDLYKTHMPTLGQGADSVIEIGARRITEACGRPWVVLSNGVRRERFATALAVACGAGASGMLAGRAVWGDAVGLVDPDEFRRVVDERVRELSSIIDAAVTPLPTAGGRGGTSR